MNIAKRVLGKTGEEVSIVGLGGYHIGVSSLSDDESVALIRRAVDEGITFLDNAWAYNDGRSEELMGRVLRDGYREKVFLMTKFPARERDEAMEQLDESLRRLQTDHLDLWQMHAMGSQEDIDQVSAPGGALEALNEAKRMGKVRFVGFTGHRDPQVHVKTLDLYDFDTVQMPLNVMDAHFRSFQETVLPLLQQRHIGVIGMKSLAGGHVLQSGVVTPQEAIGYSLSLPVSVVVCGMDSIRILEQNLGIARDFRSLMPDAANEIALKTAPEEISGDGRYEVYKTGRE